MRFVSSGPDIPEPLLRAHEDGHVVFFCGAGVSRPAGLPDFAGLIKAVRADLHLDFEASEEAALSRKEFDRVFDHLENRIADGRSRTRKAVWRALQPAAKPDLGTHRALLDLARHRTNGAAAATRLITTHFDLLFELAGGGRNCECYSAPAPPIPKNNGWNGVVHLHGRIADKNDGDMDCMVLTSGDFGLAYLVEGWASRFIADVFAKYVVCFVGYSLGDPVLRYIMDALAADRRRGEADRAAYAFTLDGKDEPWIESGVVTIPYNADNSHSTLHSSIQEWARVYKSGALGKAGIVARHAMDRPTEGAPNDDFIDRVLWALRDPSGIPAKRFASMPDPPPIEWLIYLVDEANKEPLLRVGDDASWNDVNLHLSAWAARHWSSEELLLMAAQGRGALNGRIQNAIATLLNEHRAAFGPKEKLFSTAWSLIFCGRVRPQVGAPDSYRFLQSLEKCGATAAARFRARTVLAPRLAIRRLPEYRRSVAVAEPSRLTDLFECQVVLGSSDDARHFAQKVSSQHWQGGFPEVLPDLHILVRDALEILHEIGHANEYSDGSAWLMPSISAHPQNSFRRSDDWVLLVAMLRDAWLAQLRKDPGRARDIALSWWTEPYPLFKRLALFASTMPGIDPGQRWLDELLDNDGRWLWSIETRREVMRAIVQASGALPPDKLARLEQAILAGPPRRIVRPDTSDEEWALYVDRAVWLRLEKLAAASVPLSQEAGRRSGEIHERHPAWRLANDESDEFTSFIRTSHDAGSANDEQSGGLIGPHRPEQPPRDLKSLGEWLRRPPSASEELFDPWPECCRNEFDLALDALRDLAEINEWPRQRWSEALLAWSEDGFSERSWMQLGPTLEKSEDANLDAIAGPLGWWLRSVAKTINLAESNRFLAFLQRVYPLLGAPADPSETDPVKAAINSGSGFIAESVLRLWSRTNPVDGVEITGAFKDAFEGLCDPAQPGLQFARILLASRAVPLFKADREWFCSSLAPFFDWDSGEAAGIWSGFLWQAPLYIPLMQSIGPDLLATAGHYAELGEWARRYAELLTLLALGPDPFLPPDAVRRAFAALPTQGAAEVAKTLAHLQASAENPVQYWSVRAQPFMRELWPKSATLRSDDLTLSLVRLALAAGPMFPQALEEVKPHLHPVDDPWDLCHAMAERAGVVSEFPSEALRLLSGTVQKPCRYSDELPRLLEQIAEACPGLSADHRYVRLRELI